MLAVDNGVMGRTKKNEIVVRVELLLGQAGSSPGTVNAHGQDVAHLAYHKCFGRVGCELD